MDDQTSRALFRRLHPRLWAQREKPAMNNPLESAIDNLPSGFQAIAAARISPKAAIVLGQDSEKYVVWSYHTHREYSDGYYTQSLAEAWVHFEQRVTHNLDLDGSQP